MRILFTNKISPEFGGGGELIIKEIGKRLGEMGHKVFLLTASEIAHPSNFSFSNGILTYYIPQLLKPLYTNDRLRFLLSRYSFYILSPPFIAKFVKELNIDIIHDYASPIPSSATLIGHHFKIPTVLTVHEVLFRKAFACYDSITALAKLLGDYLIKALSPNRIIAVSDFTRKMLLRTGIEEDKISTIPNGVDHQIFHPPDDFEKTDEPTVVSVGRLVPQKRIFDVLFAAKKIVREIPNVNFYILGKGKLEQKLRLMIARLGLNKNVHILGFLPLSEVVKYLQQARVFVTASLQEGFGIASAEAMACGTPVVAYDVPALNELVTNEEDGLLVQDGNIQQFSQAIIFLLKNRELAENYGRRAAQKVKEKYSWDKATCQLIDVYKSVIT